jgi:hypothetical protein
LTAVVGYEYYGRPYVIGEAPGRREGPPLGGARKRIGDLIGLSEEEMARRFRWENLLDAWPGYGPNGGSAFPMDAARIRAYFLREEKYPGSRFILLGRRVADAFWFKQPWFVWSNDLTVAPHPSGLSRWWNDPENLAAAKTFWTREAGIDG